MAKTFTKIPADTFSTLQINAGILTTSFEPTKAATTPSSIICATTGGISFKDTPTYNDFGEDIDNCPPNMKELKRLKGHEVTLSGTAVSLSSSFVGKLVGPNTTSSETGVTKVVPKNELGNTDFEMLWWVGDYGDDGWVAIKLINALSTDGFALQTTNDGKGNSAFTFTGHYSIDAQDTVPYEIYICPSKSAS